VRILPMRGVDLRHGSGLPGQREGYAAAAAIHSWGWTGWRRELALVGRDCAEKKKNDSVLGEWDLA
jgi:hypothetical protein